MSSEWKDTIRDQLEALGRPYVVIVYDTPIEPGAELQAVPKRVPFWVRSKIEPESVTVALGHIVEVTDRERSQRGQS